MQTTIDCLPCTPAAEARGLPAAPADLMGRALADPLYNDAWANTQTAAGEWVDERTCLVFLAVYAAVKVLSETLATFPLCVCQVLPDGSEIPDPTDPLYPVLRHRPNKETSSYVWKETSQSHLATFGNAYSEIQRNRRGDVVGLWQRTPDRFRPRRRVDTHELYYEYFQPWTGMVELEPADVLHVPGLGFDGIMGYSVIRIMAESIGLGVGAQRFAGEFYANDAKPGGVLEYPGQLTDTSFERLKKRWQVTGGTHGARHKLRILEEGMKWVQTQITPEDSQLILTRKFQVEDVARAYRVPPHFLQDLDHATFSNIEELGLQFITYTMLPWVERWEDELNYKLLNNDPRRVIRFMLNRFLRADVTKRSGAYVQGRQWGWYSANDVRRKEGEAPINGGDVYLSPLNMVPVGRIADIYGTVEGTGQTEPTTDPVANRAAAIAAARSALTRGYAPLFLDAARRVLKREAHAIEGRMERERGRGGEGESLAQWAATFYLSHEQFSRAAWLPIVTAAAAAANPDCTRAEALDALANQIARTMAIESRADIDAGQPRTAPADIEARATATAAAAMDLVLDAALSTAPDAREEELGGRS